jgi:hypothetical protein
MAAGDMSTMMPNLRIVYKTRERRICARCKLIN